MSKYRYRDSNGQYRTDNLTGPGTSEGESGTAWRGFDPTTIGRCWSVPRTGKYAEHLDKSLLPGYLSVKSVHGRLDALDEAEMIHYSSREGGMPALKRYLLPDAGQLPGDLWTDIDGVNAQAKERVGYPTQKPIALLERIIKASSNEGDVMLDPFRGCATALVAAEKLGRHWVGIDLSSLAVKLVLSRLQQAADDGALLHSGKLPDVHHRTDIPSRTDLGDLPSYRTHRHTLYGRQEGVCAGCEVMFPFRNMTVDHVVPQSKGGSDHLDNLQLLCGACNSKKGVRSQDEFIAKLREEGLRQ